MARIFDEVFHFTSFWDIFVDANRMFNKHSPYSFTYTSDFSVNNESLMDSTAIHLKGTNP
jgi:hypothetical protein